MILTKDEAYAVAEFIDMNLIDLIKTDTGLDSVYWLSNMIHALEKLSEYSGYKPLTYPSKKEEEEK